jgi:hypothetical protein
MLARKVAFGTPSQVIARILDLRGELGIDGIVAELNPGGRIPAELEMRSLELLTHEVIPALR